MRQLRAGRLSEAAVVYRKLLAIRPDVAEAHYHLGNILWRQGTPGEAVRHYEQAISLRPGYPEAHNDLGIILAQHGRLDEALARFERAVALNPKYAEAHNNLGNVFSQQGKLDLAGPRYEQAIALSPDYFGAARQPGLHPGSSKGDFERAAKYLERALPLRPGDAGAHCNLGNVLCEQGQPRPGHDALRKGLGPQSRPAGALQQPGQRAVAAGPVRRSGGVTAAGCGPRSQMCRKPMPTWEPSWRNNRNSRKAAAQFQLAIELKPDFTPMPTTDWATSCCSMASSS